MVEEGFKVNGVSVPVEAVGPPVTYVNVYRYPAYLSDEILCNALAQYAVDDVVVDPIPSFGRGMTVDTSLSHGQADTFISLGWQDSLLVLLIAGDIGTAVK
ncbi:hypothetical protein MRX96_043468 [Rhipicephalus microplus]